MQCLMKNLKVLPHIGMGGAVLDEESVSPYWNGGGQCLKKFFLVLEGCYIQMEHGLHRLQSSTSTKYKYALKRLVKKIEYDVFLSTLCITITPPTHIHGSVRSYWIKYSSNHVSSSPVPRLPLFFVLQFVFSITHGSGRAAKNRKGMGTLIT